MIEPKMAGDYVDWSKEVPKELWEQIVGQADNPALLTTCKLFKSIIYDPATTVKNLEANFKDQFPLTFFEAKNRDNVALLKIARMLLHERLVTLLPQETMDCFREVENLNYYSFVKILNDEYCFNLSQIFKDFIPQSFMKKINKETSRAKKIDAIYDFMKIFPEYICRVSNLSLDKLNLTLIPKELCLFPEVIKINLSHNNITNIPEFFGKNWKELEDCDLSNNQLTNLPNDFGNNWNLKLLNISKNKITELNKDFGNSWNSLKRIDLSQNQIKTLLPEFGKNWTHLLGISLFSNHIDSLPDDFGSHWKEVYHIRFSHNPLKLDEKKIKEKTHQNVNIIQ